MAVVDPKELVKDVDALMADVDMAGSCCNVPDGKTHNYRMTLHCLSWIMAGERITLP
jgi:hypothetical protein